MSNIDGFQAKQLHNYAKVMTKIPRTWFRMLIDRVLSKTVNLEQCAISLTVAMNSIIVTNCLP